MSNKIAKTDSVSIIVATYGDAAHWNEVAKSAVASAEAQTVECEVIRMHRGTLADARNEAAFQANSEWLCFLDADDALAPDYVEQMLAHHGDIRRPATLGVYPNGETDDYPVMIPKKDIKHSNYIVIGALVRKEMFDAVGGFRDLEALEDWDLWIRCIRSGAKVVDVPTAVYRVTINTDSRNKNVEKHNRAFNEIRKRYW